MPCDRIDTIDRAEYLADPAADRWAEFRQHFIDCPDCAAEVARWSAVEEALAVEPLPDGQMPGAAHPDAERLVLLAQRPEALGDALGAVRAHVDDCPTCRLELATFERFDFAAHGIALTSPSDDSTTRAQESERESAPGWLERITIALGLDGLGLTPAGALAGFAVAGVALLLVWRSLPGEPRGADSPTPSRSFVEAPLPQAPAPQEISPTRESPPSPAIPKPDPSGLAGGKPGESEPLELAETLPAPPPSPIPLEEAPPKHLPEESLAESAPPEPIPPKEAEGADDAAAAREVILIAALDALPTAGYRRPDGAIDLVGMGDLSTTRGTQGLSLRVLAPHHTGLTRLASPRLWIKLSAATKATIRVTVTDPDADEPLTEIERRGPHDPGLLVFDLASTGVELDPGLDYRWTARVEVDPSDPARNPFAVGSIRRLAAEDPRARSVTDVPATERGHAAAANGLWYDAYDFFASLAQQADGDAARRHQAALEATLPAPR